MNTIDLSVTTINGTIPATNLPVGPGSNQVAAGNDPRLTNSTRSVASIADLRALSVPGAGIDSFHVSTVSYHLNSHRGGNQFTWVANSTLVDNAGTVIALTSNGTNPGRFVADNYGNGTAHVEQFGADPAQSSTINRQAIQTAHDSLPIQGSFNGLVTASGRQARFGSVEFGVGGYDIDQKLYFFADRVHVRGKGSLNTNLILDPGVYTDPAHPVFVVDFELAIGADQNNHFGASLEGLSLICISNAGSSGIFLSGAQGTMLGDLFVINFGVVGIDFTGEKFDGLRIDGAQVARGPLLKLQAGGGSGMTGTFASVEHGAAGDPLDSNNHKIPSVLIRGVGVTIDALDGETVADSQRLFCLMDDTRNCSIRYTALSNSFSLAYRITGNSGNNDIGKINAPATANFVHDDARTGGDGRPFGYDVTIPGQTYLGIYRQMDYVQAMTVNSLSAQSVTVQGQPVVHEAFASGNLYGTYTYGAPENRFRLKLSLALPNGYSIPLPLFLIHATTEDAKGFTALLTLVRPYSYQAPYNAGAPPQVQVQLLRGSGLLYTPSLTSTGGTILFSLVKPPLAAGNLEITSFTVTQIGAPLNFGETVAWSTEYEDNSAVNDGTAQPNVYPPVTPNSTGKVPVSSLILHSRYVDTVTKSSSSSLVNVSDPDIEATTQSGAFTLQLHSSANNFGLERVITNVTASPYGNTLTISTSSSDLFSNGLNTLAVAPGESVRLKVDTTGSKFLIL